MRDGKPCVLIVNGNETTRNAMKQLLERQIYEVSAQKDAKQAMDYLNSHQDEVDLMITDLDLHSLNGNGLDLIKIIRLTSKQESLPCVLMMDSLDRPEFNEALELECEDVYTNDIDDRLFVLRVRNILSRCMKPDYSNVMEDILERIIKRNAKSLGICLCRTCKNDLVTLSLNNLKPKYVSSERGRILASVDQLNRDYEPQILRVLTESAEKIKKNPRHRV